MDEVSFLRRRVTELEAENARLTLQLAAAVARAGPGGGGGGGAASSAQPPPAVHAARRGSVGGAALRGGGGGGGGGGGASSAPSSPAKAAAAEADVACGTCGRAVPAASLAMHLLHCARTTARCASCGAAVAARELEAHVAAERGTPSALAQAAAAGDAAAVERMLQHGQSVGAVCGVAGSGDLALHVAARHRRAAVAELLLARGCPVNAVNAAGETPLHAACASGGLAQDDGGGGGGKEDGGGADSRSTEGSGERARVVAASAVAAAAAAAASAEALRELVALLVRRGCDVEARTPLGDSAVDLAQRARNHDVLLLLGALPGRPASRDARSRPGSGRMQLPGLGVVGGAAVR